MPLPVRRALLSVSDKTGLIELARALCSARRRDRCPPAAPRGLLAAQGIPVTEVAQPHRLPRNHGRARQDAAPEDPRRPARPPRHRRCGDGRARHRAHRPAGGEPLSVRRHHRPPGVQLRGGDREHRHRRPGDAARRGQEPRRRAGGGRPGRLRRAARGARRTRGRHEFATRARLAAKAFAHTAAYDAMVAAYLAARHPDAARRHSPPPCR